MGNRCEKCREYFYDWETKPHKCKPVFLVWKDEDQDESDAREIYKNDAEEAAEEWADRDDCESADYSIVSGNDVVLCVKSADGTITKFDVSGESVPRYTAHEKVDAPNV